MILCVSEWLSGCVGLDDPRDIHGPHPVVYVWWFSLVLWGMDGNILYFVLKQLI